jgi:hypothetical protein
MVRRSYCSKYQGVVLLGRFRDKGHISRETQAERNQPCRESCYCSPEISTNVAISDPHPLQTEELSHQPMPRGV